jgi:hypothetical protein
MQFFRHVFTQVWKWKTDVMQQYSIKNERVLAYPLGITCGPTGVREPLVEEHCFKLCLFTLPRYSNCIDRMISIGSRPNIIIIMKYKG